MRASCMLKPMSLRPRPRTVPDIPKTSCSCHFLSASSGKQTSWKLSFIYPIQSYDTFLQETWQNSSKLHSGHHLSDESSPMLCSQPPLLSALLPAQSLWVKQVSSDFVSHAWESFLWMKSFHIYATALECKVYPPMVDMAILHDVCYTVISSF